MGGKTDPHTTTRHWNVSHLYTPSLSLNKLKKKKKNEKEIIEWPYLSPTTVFPAAAKCMSSNGGQQTFSGTGLHPYLTLRSTTVFNTAIQHAHCPPSSSSSPSTPPPHKVKGHWSPLGFDILMLWTCAITKATTPFFFFADRGKRHVFFFLCCRACVSETSFAFLLTLCSLFLYFFLFIVLYPG